MKLPVIILLLFLSRLSVGQENFHRQTEHGNKIGEWPEYYANNKVKLINVYGTPTSLSVTEKAVAFQLGLKMDSIIDTTIFYDNLLYTDYYEYNDDWHLNRIRREYEEGKTIYLYGQENQIGIYDDRIKTIIGRVSEKTELTLPLINFSKNDIILTLESSGSIKIEPSPLYLLGGDTVKVIAKVEPSGDHEGVIMFKNPEVTIELPIRSYGYHVKSEDLNGAEPIRVKGNKLNYYRTGGEALLNIYDSSKNNVLQTESLAFQKTEIDLNQLKSGKYWLQIIDFSGNQKKWLKLELEY